MSDEYVRITTVTGAAVLSLPIETPKLLIQIPQE